MSLFKGFKVVPTYLSKHVSLNCFPSEAQLRSDRFARHVWGKCGLTNFQKRRAAWLEHQTGESKKRKMFSDILE
uniref:Uncharacterized protein n=1 Tax=Astyanax mexicanus TaxID=7994 RepID=A0A8B9JAY5_ASTMX